MPAIRYYHQCVFAVADHLPGGKPVEVKMRDGTYMRLDWLGMICEAAAERLPGLGYGKIRAHEVTDGDGLVKCDWRRLKEGEHVLGWRCLAHNGSESVYGVVDNQGWPVVIGKHGRKGAPKLQLVGYAANR